MKSKTERRVWRKQRIRKKIRGTGERPRLSVFRSATHIYAQVIDDEKAQTVLATSSLSKEIAADDNGSKTAVAKKVGELLAKKCLAKKISKVVFDRNGFIYHGRIKALADAARKAGLEF